MADAPVVREARSEDCEEIRRLIQELADFEKMPDGPEIGAEVLRADGFDSTNPAFNCFVIQGEAQLLGYALYFPTYSTWTGRALYLEDLYVTPSHRKQGLGKKLFTAVAKKAHSTGCHRLNFSVLDWNPAQRFYEDLGATNITQREGWQHYRLQGPALAHLATS